MTARPAANPTTARTSEELRAATAPEEPPEPLEPPLLPATSVGLDVETAEPGVGAGRPEPPTIPVSDVNCVGSGPCVALIEAEVSVSVATVC